MLPSRKSWSFTIQLYWHFSKSWSQIQKVGVKNSKFGVNETSDLSGPPAFFSVFSLLLKELSFYILKHVSRLKLVVFLIALFMVLVHVSVVRATVWKRKFYHGPAVIDILNKYMYRYTLESNIPGKLKLFYFSFFDLR